MNQLDYNKIKSVYDKYGYSFPTSPNKVILKITGIRSNTLLDSIFNDTFAVCWEENGKPQFLIGSGTTHPGAYYLKHPMNPAGAAYLIPGYYANVWKMGIHNQNPNNRSLNPIGNFMIWRDAAGGNLLPKISFANNAWQAIDSNGKMLAHLKAGPDTGIELHGTRQNWNAGGDISNWSAGCQIIESWKIKEKVMDLAQRHATDNETKAFSYALTVEDDFKEIS